MLEEVLLNTRSPYAMVPAPVIAFVFEDDTSELSIVAVFEIDIADALPAINLHFSNALADPPDVIAVTF